METRPAHGLDVGRAWCCSKVLEGAAVGVNVGERGSAKFLRLGDKAFDRHFGARCCARKQFFDPI
jgi:hypothetical protein